MSTYNEFDAAVGMKIKLHREVRKISQGELVEKMSEIGIPMWNRSVVTNLERGRRHLKFSEAIALAKIYRIPVTALASQESVKELSKQDAEYAASRMDDAIESLVDALNNLKSHMTEENRWV